MTDPLEIRLLGPFEVVAGGRPVEVSGSKRRGLLALLALRSGRVVGVEELIDVAVGRGSAGRATECGPAPCGAAARGARSGVDRRAPPTATR